MGKRVRFIMPKSEKKQLLTHKRGVLVMGIHVAILGVLTATLESTSVSSLWIPIVGAIGIIVATAIVELLFKKWKQKDQDLHSAKHSEHA